MDDSQDASSLPNAKALEDAVRNAQARDHEAFTLLFQYYKLPLWRRLWYLVGNDELAYDLYQETFIRVWRSLPTKPENAPFEAWLYEIARNLALDHFRHQNKLQFLVFPEPESESEPILRTSFTARFSVPGHEERICELDCLRLALAQLSPQYRTCILLQDLWGYSQHEIAEMLRISESTVSANVSRGKKRLQAIYKILLKEQGVSSREGEQTS